ncbi:MAG TPA: hypothetical protein EYO59_00010 [Chromatiaceae bacterium]|nr:hypothetical protein [Chromatiaceae bacterium]HIO46583.1 hypothetical protein [Candidatus Poribacteria bacterium]
MGVVVAAVGIGVGVAGGVLGGVMGAQAADDQQRQIENQMDAMWLASLSDAAPRALAAVGGARAVVSQNINQVRAEQAQRILSANFATQQAELQKTQSIIQGATGIAASGVGAYSGYKADQLATKRHTELTKVNQPYAATGTTSSSHTSAFNPGFSGSRGMFEG